MEVQLSAHPRGVLISFWQNLSRWKRKRSRTKSSRLCPRPCSPETAWVGAERVRDIVNTYDPESYKLPYGLENDFFQIKWKVGEGITSFYNKKSRG